MKKLIYLPLFFIAMPILLASCKKDSELNDTPNPPTEEKFSAEQLLNEEALTRSLDSSIKMANDSIEGLHKFKKSPIPFVSFEMVDRTGVPIPPNKVLSLGNGTKITAQAYFARLNSIEKWLNANGGTLRSNQPVIASETVTEKEYLDDLTEKQPQLSEDLLSETDQENLMMPVEQVGNLLLKPMSEYTPEELKILEGYVFNSSGDDNVTVSRGSATIPNIAFVPNSSVLKVINNCWIKEQVCLFKPDTSVPQNVSGL